MPKVSTVAAASGGSSAKDATALRRNQACKQCRKRKLKCDAQKPHCSTCVKQWNAQIAVPPPIGFSHPAQPLCIYDHMEGLGLTPINADIVDDPRQRIMLLETQISELQNKLVSAQRETGTRSRSQSETHPLSSSITPPTHPTGNPGPSSDPRSSASPPNPFQWLSVPGSSSNGDHGPSPFKRPRGVLVDDHDATPTAQQQQFQYPQPPRASGSSRPSSSASGHPTSSSAFNDGGYGAGNLTGITSNNSSRVFAGNVDLDVENELAYNNSNSNGSPYMAGSYEIMFSGWNPDLPDPRLLNHLVSLYFSRDTCASRVLHRPTFLLAMTLPPTHPDFPHPALLHAICASASRWTAAVRDSRDAKKGERDKFAEFHAAKTRSYIDQTIATGQNIFSVLLAGIVISWWYYSEGRWVEVWSNAGFLTRVSIPLGLNYPGTHRSNPSSSYLAPPRNPTDLEQRRRAWWMCLMFDRIVSVGGWPHGIDERDVGTEFPLKRIDFEAENPVPSNPQDLASENLMTRHNPVYTDPFILFLKACMLFGRVTDYNTRMVNLRGPRSPPPFTSHHNPEPPVETFRPDPRMAAGFRSLDRLVAVEFLASLPPNMRSCLGVQPQPQQQGQQGEMPNHGELNDVDGTSLDTDLYMVHVVPHAAIITLHNPYINFSDPQCVSAARCLSAARSILNSYYLITTTSFDLKRLHPFITICWYLAAVVLVQLCKRLIEVGDKQREASVWGEINVMRLAMMEFGNVSPIGIRQEKLLQGLMSEIVRLTSQQQPLAVGVPLYPFSRHTLYDPTFQPTISEVAETSSAINPSAAKENNNVSSLAGRTGERLRGHSQSHSSHSHSHSGSHSHSHSHSNSIPMAPQAMSYMDASVVDTMSGAGVADLGIDMSTHGISGLGIFAGSLGPMSMISAQGIWRPLDGGVDQMYRTGDMNGESTMDIFDQLGL